MRNMLRLRHIRGKYKFKNLVNSFHTVVTNPMGFHVSIVYKLRRKLGGKSLVMCYFCKVAIFLSHRHFYLLINAYSDMP